jgi:hypothetical protein
MNGSSMNNFFGRVLTPRNGGMSSNMMAACYESNMSNSVEHSKIPKKKLRKITIVGGDKESGEKKRTTYTLNAGRNPNVYGTPETGFG